MRILLISNYKLDQQQSMLRYSLWIYLRLKQNFPVVDMVSPPALFGRLPTKSNQLAKWLRYIDKFLLAPPVFFFLSFRYDLVHVCDQGNAFYAGFIRKRKSVITCHDVLALQMAKGLIPGRQTSFTGRVFQRMIEWGMGRAGRIICVSQHTADGLRKLFADAHSVVIANPLNWDYHPASEVDIEDHLTAISVPKLSRYAFHIGGHQWYKNRRGVVDIYENLLKKPAFADLKLVMAGKPLVEFEHDDRIRRLNIIYVENPSNELLRSLYSGAEFLLFPSLAEGFGWPIIEAQACGCLVVTTNAPPMNEISGGQAILIDSTDAKIAADQINSAWSKRTSLRDAGLKNAENYSPEIIFKKYIDFYRDSVAQSSQQTP